MSLPCAVFTETEECDLISECQFFSPDIPTSLNSSQHPVFKIYPNPSNGIFHIDFEQLVSHAKISLVNSYGAIIKTQELTHTKNLSFGQNLSPGIYFILIEINKQVYKTEKIIVQ